MTMTDPIADMLTRLRNANVAMHDEVLMPASKQKEALAGVLVKEGYIVGFSIGENSKGPGNVLKIDMKYSEERRRVCVFIASTTRSSVFSVVSELQSYPRARVS